MERSAYEPAIAPFDAELARLRPAGVELLDAHTHLGVDEDGYRLDLATLLDWLDAAAVARACVFPLHDPERRPAYRVPNDRVHEWARESGGRLLPFTRLDPGDGALEEAERGLANGTRGIKLHPRAQGFAFAGEEIEGIFGLAERARVPILIHAGRGLPPIAEGLVGLAERHPDIVLILAHAAIADQAQITHGLADHPGVLYDVSCLLAVDVLELFARVPAERIVFGSDPPYGHPRTLLYLTLRVAAMVGADEQALRAILGGTIGAALEGEPLPLARPPLGSGGYHLRGPLARVYTYLAMAAPAVFQGLSEQARGGIELALAACRDPDPGAAGPALEMIAAALTAASRLLAEPGGRPAALDLLHRSLTHAATEPL